MHAHQAEAESREIDRASSYREWQQFLDRAVHDLGGPLRGIGASTGLLAEMSADALDDDGRELLKTILDGVLRMDMLLKAIADFSMALQSDGYTVGPVPGQGVVRSALDEIAPLIKETRARIDYAGLPSVNGNWDRLSVLFRNLVQNSLQYRGSEAPLVTIAARREDRFWRFAVTDNGTGIDAQYWDRIFLPFQRLHTQRPRGAGLGLAVCRKIVESHGGKIWVESRIGSGSTFFFTLPEAD